ncbi:MAG: hypothetical protein AAF488_13595, partial [Planctomycetota bacterium]
PNHGAGYWTRFKELIDDHSRRDPVGNTSIVEGRAGFDLQTRGYRLERLESLAPRGDVRVTYVASNVFWAIDCLAFLIAILGLWAVLRLPGVPHLRTMVTALAVGMVFVWFSGEAGSEIARSAVAGFAVASVIVLLGDAKRAMGRFRRRRLALAPDPFLEEAGRDDDDASEERASDEAKGEESSDSSDGDEGKGR